MRGTDKINTQIHMEDRVRIDWNGVFLVFPFMSTFVIIIILLWQGSVCVTYLNMASNIKEEDRKHGIFK